MEQHFDLQHEHHQGHHPVSTESEIVTTISYKNNTLTVYLTDQKGNAPELELTHEKMMHIIVVSPDLNEYYHIHPVQRNESIFEKKMTLRGPTYKAFIDIKPKRKAYMIEPIPFEVDSSIHVHHNENQFFLQVDHQLTKEINGRKVELIHDPFQIEKDIKLTFDIKNGTPDPYLGALGHVVIIDENVQEFIHVHPISTDETIFEAHFNKAGIYKLWAEFKFDNEVIAFPYVIEVR